jgi:pimeloyl-ACP methyl ester carboxylesterase
MDMRWLDRGEGRLAYEVVGDGPLVVLVCGMGDRRSAWRHVVPALVAAGYRCATLDPRGHGDSDTTFSAYGPDVLAEDILALVGELGGGPAVLVGHSAAAAAAVRAAALQPEKVCSVALVGPVVRDGRGLVFLRLLTQALLLPPWGAWFWGRYYRTLFHAGVPADHEQHMAQIVAQHQDRAHRWATAELGMQSKASCAARAGEVRVPVLALVGDKDPDVNPQAEAQWLQQELRAKVELLPGVGHYPHMEIPEKTVSLLLPFLEEQACRAA